MQYAFKEVDEYGNRNGQSVRLCLPFRLRLSKKQRGKSDAFEDRDFQKPKAEVFGSSKRFAREVEGPFCLDSLVPGASGKKRASPKVLG